MRTQTRIARILPGVTEPLAHDLDAMAGAGGYNAWLVDRAGPWLRGRVLDAGAGIGTHTGRLRERADEVVALEPEPELASMLRRQVPGVKVVEGDANAVEGPFDAIVCFNVLEHIADDEGTLRRFRELLAPGGTLCVIVPAHPWLFRAARPVVRPRASLHSEPSCEGSSSGPARVTTIRHVNPVGALGWLVQARVLRREHVATAGARALRPAGPAAPRVRTAAAPFGLSLWAVAKTTGTASASATNA